MRLLAHGEGAGVVGIGTVSLTMLSLTMLSLTFLNHEKAKVGSLTG